MSFCLSVLVRFCESDSIVTVQDAITKLFRCVVEIKMKEKVESDVVQARDLEDGVTKLCRCVVAIKVKGKVEDVCAPSKGV